VLIWFSLLLSERPPLQSLVRLLTPALNRLNSLLQPNPPLELYDLPCLADMCDFDSQAEGDDWKGWSRWCGIFTREEREVLGHWRDAQRYFWVGEGSVSNHASCGCILS
jgi:hypothetical protein